MGNTMRKAFNFYRSYYEVLKDIYDPLDRLAFLEAILDRQFTGKHPSLKGIPKLAYNSQRHAIDKSVEGYENATGEKLTPTQGYPEGPSVGPTQGSYGGPLQDPLGDPIEGTSGDTVMTTEGPYEGPYQDPSVQEQEEEKEEEKVKEEELTIFDADNYINRILSTKGV
jgi:hypothetical protein